MKIPRYDSVSMSCDPVYVRVYVISYPARNSNKFTPKQRATMLVYQVLLYLLALLLTASYSIGCGALMLQVMMLMSLHETY